MGARQSHSSAPTFATRRGHLSSARATAPGPTSSRSGKSGGIGINLTTNESNNIDIGHQGVAGESNTIRLGTSGTQTKTFVAGISGITVIGGVPVYVNAAGQLGTATSTVPVGTPRFVDNGDGTVTDTKTGLMWEKKTDDGSVHDKDNTYTWSTGSPWNPNGTAFTVFLAKLNDTAGGGVNCFAGYCDWRLPSVGRDGGTTELEALLDTTQGYCGGGTGPCTYPGLGPTIASYYWSATTYTAHPDFAWAVYFYDGATFAGSKSSAAYVRAVRGGV